MLSAQHTTLGKPNLVLIVEKSDHPHIQTWGRQYRDMFGRVDVTFNCPSTFMELKLKYPHAKRFATTNRQLLQKLIANTPDCIDPEPNIQDYRGSLFKFSPPGKDDGTECVVFTDMYKLEYDKEAQFLTKLWMKKIAEPTHFYPTIPWTWEAINQRSDFDRALATVASASLVAVDVETSKENLRIDMCGFACLLPNGKIHVIVVPYNSSSHVFFARKLLALPNVKVMQNGHYDCSYFIRHNQPPTNYLLDTYHMQHCMFAELPKNLAFISAMWVRDVRYWKEESKTGNDWDRQRYNAKDCYYTLMAMLGQLRAVQSDPFFDYVLKNYELEFPKLFPALHSGLIGIKIDRAEMETLNAIETAKFDWAKKKLQTWLKIPTFNPGSPQQVSKLLHILSKGRISGSDKKDMQTFRELGVWQDHLIAEIIKYRKAKKAASTYFQLELLHERLHYKLDVAGTETSRLASKASDFWCGTQIQNIPAYAKSMAITDSAEERFAEIDGCQAESRTTAYLSQDEVLIHTVETSPDFHKTNASLFFGLPFEAITKDIRTVAKRTNHGANYNMGAKILWDTMGTKALLQAAKLLNLPCVFRPLDIAEYLLDRFDQTYKRVRGAFQDEIINEVRTTGRLVLPTGWTRICFGRPWENKLDLNSYVAHKPQGLSVNIINAAYLRVWRKFCLIPFLTTGQLLIRIRAQIHDSLFFSYLLHNEFVVQQVQAEMTTTMEVNGRMMKLPFDAKYGAKRWSELKD